MRRGIFRMLLRLLCCASVLFPAYSWCGPVHVPGFNGSFMKTPAVQTPVSQPSVPVNIPGFYGPLVTPPPSTELPQLKQPSVAIPGVSGLEYDPSQNQLVIHQNQPQTIIDWASFNIGADAWTQFDQQGNSTWVALNRIWDKNPSVIFGKLTADGKIYLINQNGILFGPGSQVNVNTLVASALNIKNTDFINGTLKFYLEDGKTPDDVDIMGRPYYYQCTDPTVCAAVFAISYPVDSTTSSPNAAVSNLGEINSATGGAVFLIGPRVENFGSINAPIGQIGLAAGTSIELLVPSIDTNQDTTSNTRTALIVYVKEGFGEAANREGGQLTADQGMAGMYGGVVNQDGLIRSVTAVSQHGQIELIATDKISTGSNSLTESPVSDSSDKVDNSFTFSGGAITMHGNFDRPDLPEQTPSGLIELKGVIDAPSGTVTLNAKDRIFLDTGSRINVGGAWSDEAATAEAIEAQLNSVELRDAYGQKGGLLQGKTITVNVLTGSSIGDVSGDILTQQKTALEKAVAGGNIYIYGSGGGDVIVKQGAALDFSGGGINYSGGALETTKLLSGTQVYDIGKAPANLQYDKVIGQYKRTYDGFGVQDTYSGLYYGGASPLKTTYLDSFTSGGDAGKLQVAAGTVVLDGQLNGSATRGLFQNAWTTTSDSDRNLSMLRGLEVPRGGNLIIGYPPTETNVGTQDLAVKGIEVRSETAPLDAGFGADSPLTNQKTVVSASMVNAAGLGSFALYANTVITTDSDAHIQLSPGGSFTAYARRIDHSGDVSVPGGTISLTVSDYILPDAQVTDKIFLASGSHLDVSGQRVDNSLVGKSPDASVVYGKTDAGHIELMDKTDNGQGVFIQTGAIVDVSGGYTIDQSGKVSGGTAGSLTIQGTNIMLNGDLRGYALADPDGKISGGSITLRSTNISVDRTAPAWPADFTADDDVPSSVKGKLVFAGNRFDDTGFTQITLNSLNDIIIEPNTTIATSLVRLNDPMALRAGASTNGIGQIVAGRPDLVRLDDSTAFMAGQSSITANAGQVFVGSYDNAKGNLIDKVNNGEKIVVSAGSEVVTAPGAGSAITLSAPALVDVAGTLESLSGTINVKTTATADVSGAKVGDVEIRGSARILADGYNRPDATAAVSGLGVNYNPVAGGQVSITAQNDLVLEAKSLIDVSGSAPVENVVRSDDGKLITYQDASDPGILSLTFSGSLTWAGDVKAGQLRPAGVRGGTLIVSNSNTGNVLDVNAGSLQTYIAAGFDDVTLQSKGSLQLSGPINASVGRELTLDAPEISGSGGSTVALLSPWITLANTSGYPATGSPAYGSGHLVLSSTGWLDLEGSVKISGFKDLYLEAARDIRLTDYSYGASNVWEGKLSTAGDLIMKADRIYPTTLSTYQVYSNGKTTVLPADNPVGGTIYSAGGSLTIGALGGIEVQGVLAAPMGTINLQNYIVDPGTSTGGRIYLADGSVVTTAGNAMVNYGDLDVNGAWTIPDKAAATGTISVDSVPQKAVTINAIGGDVIVRSKAEIDTSGGGSVFAYDFQPGIEGSVNPLMKSGRYVIMSDNSLQLPGDAVYLTGGGGLAAGTYSLIPADKHPEYAFLPGAYIIELQPGSSVLPGQGAVTKEGYPISVGYEAVAGTSIRGTQPLLYSVRPASDVLKEGHFDMQTLTAGDAGDLDIAGKTAIIDGVLQAYAAQGFQGGSIALSGTDVYVQASTTPLSSGFGFSTPVPNELKNHLNVSTSSLSGQGFREIDLGDQTVTDTITIGQGSVLEAPLISLTANKMITIEKGVQLNAVAQSGVGEIDLNSPGAAEIQSGSLLHASHVLNINVGSPDIQGDLQVDHSALTLTSDAIFFVHTKDSQTEQSGLYITDSLWNQLTASENITLVSKQDLSFVGDSQDNSQNTFNLSSAGNVSIDAARIAGLNSADVSLTAQSIHLSNSGNASRVSALNNTGQIALNGDNITVGSGDVLFGGFKTVSLNSKGDLTLKGQGSLATGNADLLMSAARITTAAGQKTDGTYQAANFLVVAGANKDDQNPAYSITMTAPANGQPGPTGAPGGTLEFGARRIDVDTIVEVDGGTIKLITAGAKGEDGKFLPASDETDGIHIGKGGAILAQGTDEAPGGQVILATDFIDGNGQLQSGKISLDAGSLIDVSAGYTKQGDGTPVTQGDAGLISLSAPIGGVVIDDNAVLKGSAGVTTDLQGNNVQGKGGSFVLDTNTLVHDDTNNIDDFKSLIDKLTTKKDDQGNVISGGFTESTDIRARNGDLEITAGTAIQSHNFKVTADGGKIDVSGKIDASAQTGGGRVELYAASDVTLEKDSVINVSGTKGDTAGGEVLISSESGSVNLEQGSVINASGSGAGPGGIVSLRALRTQDGRDVQMNLNGEIQGASAVYAEAFRVYDNISIIDASHPVTQIDASTGSLAESSATANAQVNDPSTGYLSDWQANTDAYMANADAIKRRLQAGNGLSDDKLHFMPGIEVRNGTGDITLATNWDLSGKDETTQQYIWRYGATYDANGNVVNPGEPGVLTLRAAGNIYINNDLVDHPTYPTKLGKSELRNSWAFNLTAGADMSSADPLAVIKGQADANGNPAGNLTIGDEKIVYTESAPIRFASGGTTMVGKGQETALGYMINNYMYYNLASFNGSIEGKVGKDLQINGGAIQTATGDIDIAVGGDLILMDKTVHGVDTFGAIRTTGCSEATKQYWTYGGGGNITLDVGGNVGRKIGEGQWTTALVMNNSQWDYTIGSAASGFNWSASYEVSSTQTGTAGLATMGGGDLAVRTGGDFLTQAGTFGQNDKGDLIIYAGGDIEGRFLNTKGRAEIHAMGNFGAANNRQVVEAFDSGIDVTAQGNIELASVINPFVVAISAKFPDQQFDNLKSFNIGYSEDASVTLRAGGDVTFGDKDPFHNPLDSHAEEILPPTLNIEAGGDIKLKKDIALLPSPIGNLSLIARRGSIDGQYINAVQQSQRVQIFVSDLSPAEVYSDTARPNLINDLFVRFLHAASPVHAGDTAPVEIRAGQDIENLKLFLPKRAEITAENGDVRDIFYYGQNINSGDVSEIRALQGNVFFSVQDTSGLNIEDTGLVQAGPGSLLLQAGGSITLGNSRGIQTVGNAFNPILGTKGSDLVILSGYDRDMTTADAGSFFDQVRTAGTDYSNLMAEGKKDQANQVIQKTRAETIEPLLGSPSGSGDINMTTSQISTDSGQDNIYIFANGKLDVGQSTVTVDSSKHIIQSDVQKTGILTAGGGAINIFANGDINVNESRVMTFLGGDITVWSDQGNINAGRGSKTQVNASPPKLQALQDNGVIIGYTVQFTPPAVGSGIRAVTFDPDGAAGPLQAPLPGDIYLFASRGTIDAGEAGISGGKVVLGATQVLNVQNISFSNGSVGVPLATAGTTGIGTLSGAGTVAQTTQLTSEAAGIGASNAAQASQMIEDIMSKWLDVKIIDFVVDE